MNYARLNMQILFLVLSNKEILRPRMIITRTLKIHKEGKEESCTVVKKSTKNSSS